MVGAVLVDKPAGPTSHDVVRIVRRATGADSAGHTGTLDPFATGLMVVLLGRATRVAQFVEGDRKTYFATAELGCATTTDDATGEPLGPPVDLDQVSEAAVLAGLARFRGPIRQRPPAYSAKQVDGQRAYALARRGRDVTLEDVTVMVHTIELVRWQAPRLEFRCTVSAGTYIRAIARDLGALLGCGAHLTALRREAIGALTVRDAIPLARVDAATRVRPPQEVLAQLPQLVVPAERRAGLRHGQALPPVAGLSGPVLLTSDEGVLLAIGAADERRVHPGVVLEVAS